MSELRDKAVAKLDRELRKIDSKAEKQFAEPCVEYLKKRCAEDESACEDILQEHKTWEKCHKYVTDQARKALGGSSGAVRDDTVYEWVEDYYHLDDKALEEKKAKEEAERKKRADEAAKKVKAKKADKKKVSPKANSPAPARNKEEPNLKKKTNEVDGQIDIFSFGL